MVLQSATFNFYRLTETIAGTPDFQRNLSLVQEVQVYLQKLIKCLATKLYSAPKLDVKHLRALLKSLSASVSAAESVRAGVEGAETASSSVAVDGHSEAG